MKIKPGLFAIPVLLIVSALACRVSSKPAEEDVNPTAIAYAQETLRAIPTNTQPVTVLTAVPLPSETPMPDLFPSLLYYLSNDAQGTTQVWKMEKDGITKNQITNGNSDVTDYDVSMANGLLAYVTNNDLYILPKDQSTPQLIVDGMTPDGSDGFFMQKLVSYPEWSNQGDRLAYAQDGLNIYSITTGTIEHFITNELNTLDNDYVMVKEMYHPMVWSPDDTQIAIGITYYEGGTTGIFHLDSRQIIKLSKRGEGGACCDIVWTKNSTQVYVSGYSYGGESSDIWMFDSTTGAPFEFLSTRTPDGRYHFGQFLHITGNQVYFFYNLLADYPVSGQTASMATSSSAIPASPSLLRQDSQYFVDVLWAEDASFALGLRRGSGDEYPYLGDLLYIPSGTDPIQPILQNVRLPKWGQ